MFLLAASSLLGDVVNNTLPYQNRNDQLLSAAGLMVFA